MSDNNDHKEQRIGLWIAGGAAALSVLSILFYAVWGWENGKIEDSPGYGQEASAAVVEETVAAASAPETQTSEASENDTADASAAESSASGTAAEQILADTQTVTAGDGAQTVVENGIVKFYFATGKADLAADTEEALQDVLAGVKEGRKAVVSGFHDATGNRMKNEELSKKRAFAVRDALLGLGVPESQIELRKPENAEGSGNNAEARRVEVVLE